jgi:hypothetical protein
MHEWERVEGRGMCGDTMRMRVPGGWLYLARECTMHDGIPTAIAMTFVPTEKENDHEQEESSSSTGIEG